MTGQGGNKFGFVRQGPFFKQAGLVNVGNSKARELSVGGRCGFTVGRFEGKLQAKRLSDFYHGCEARIAIA